MKFSFTKLAVIAALSLTSFTTNATIIMGELSIEENGTNLMTASNGKTYAGWGETLHSSYAETKALTQTGGLYEGFYIANRSEAADFFTLATGVTVPDRSDQHSSLSVTLSGELGPYCAGGQYQPKVGCGDQTLGHSSEGDGLTFWFDEGTTDEYGRAKVGRMTLYGYVNLWIWHDNLDYDWDCLPGPCGVESFYPNKSNSAWLMVPAPATSAILVIGLLGFRLARKQKRV